MNARKMKDSGIEWIGEIPEEWIVCKIKYLATMKSGESIGASEIANDGQYPVYGGNGLRGYTSAYTHDGKYILIGRQGALCGNVRSVEGKFWATEHAVVVYEYDDIDIHWFKYSLDAMNLNQYSTSAAQPGLSVEQITNILACVPPFSEQKAIAGYLDEKCAAIDQVVASKQKQNEQLAEYRQSLITEAVNKGLKSSVLMKDSGIEWIGEIPVEWEVSALKYNANLVAEKSREMNSNRVYIGLENVLPYVGKIALGDEVETIGDTLSFCTGDVLFGKLRPYLAKCFFAEFDGVCSGEFFVIRDNGRMIGKYIKYLMLSEPFLNLVIGSTYGVKMPRASWEFVGNIKLPRPPLAEQKAIAAYLDKKCGEIDALSERNKNIIESLQEYKQSLIYEAVTGKIEL